MLWVNIEEAERIQESAEDMTAAETAPSPKKDTHLKFDSIKGKQLWYYHIYFGKIVWGFWVFILPAELNNWELEVGLVWFDPGMLNSSRILYRWANLKCNYLHIL